MSSDHRERVRMLMLWTTGSQELHYIRQRYEVPWYVAKLLAGKCTGGVLNKVVGRGDLLRRMRQFFKITKSLHHATRQGHTDEVQLLMSKGTDVDAFDVRDEPYCITYRGKVMRTWSKY